MFDVVPLKEGHLEDAATLVSRRYRRLREQVPHLPQRYEEVDTLLPLLRKLLGASESGVAAIRGSRLVGFIGGWQMASFRGKRSTYSPEWANAADLGDSQRIYEEMYSRLASAWVADRYVAHYLSLFPNDTHALQALYWMNFGMVAVDAIRSLDPLQGVDPEVHIRRAEPQDLELVIELQDALWQYMKGTPTFLMTDRKDRSTYEHWLASPDRVVLLAYWRDEPVAFMRLGPADDDVCTVIYDEKTTSIYAAYTREHVRGAGIATALLDHALQSARASGYERCAVPFEPMNLLGTRFWLRHFDPVCFSVVRQVDERVIPA